MFIVLLVNFILGVFLIYLGVRAFFNVYEGKCQNEKEKVLFIVIGITVIMIGINFLHYC